MARLTPLASLALVAFASSALFACGAGTPNTGGAPDFSHTNRAGLPGGEINYGGGPTFNQTNASAPDISKTNTNTTLSGGPINNGGMPDVSKTNLGPAAPTADSAAKQSPEAAKDGGI